MPLDPITGTTVTTGDKRLNGALDTISAMAHNREVAFDLLGLVLSLDLHEDARRGVMAARVALRGGKT